ncbi:hypothetical protein Fcan01_26120 [Folsomia candida]|uniref:Uncharacterized protein n=1 Tax=Folsomia candida TaxID=158441 RepID=A0A226D476_FOLCA|nr:hypothetical protein Fcan01_26120 [Folsomia candida]
MSSGFPNVRLVSQLEVGAISRSPVMPVASCHLYCGRRNKGGMMPCVGMPDNSVLVLSGRNGEGETNLVHGSGIVELRCGRFSSKDCDCAKQSTLVPEADGELRSGADWSAIHAKISHHFDGMSRHSPEGVAFQKRSAQVGFKQAVLERDSGK